MLRKTLMTLTAIAVLGAGSTAMAMHGGGGGGHGGGHPGGSGGGGGWGGGGAAMHGSGMGPMMRGGPMATAPMVGGRAMATAPVASGRAMATAPMASGRVPGWSGKWGFHDHFHHRFHHHRFFAFGFAGPIYAYGYDSCWTRVPTYYGWKWVYVCGDYPY